MSTPPNALFSACSFIGFVLCAIPFYWHLEGHSLDAGTCLFMVWTGLECLMQCINSIVWNKNRIDKAPPPVFKSRSCRDPACLLCINRRLYLISTGKAVLPTRAEKRCVVLAELFIGLGIPILQMILQNVVSRDRYRIFEDFSPSPVTVNMLSSFLLVAVWPVVICSVSFMYGVGVIYAFYKFQRQFKRIKPSNSGLNRGHYLRLMVLSSMDLIVTIPLRVYYMVKDARLGMIPWKSWDHTHSKYSPVFRVMAFISKNRLDTARSLEISRWWLVLNAFVFFAFFGFTSEGPARIIVARSHRSRVASAP
ncbi:GPCR fungal pheromone mating factor [Russula brevipes]|nr:GPCR fungal pheromone mating factor [Russula brevipes]